MWTAPICAEVTLRTDAAEESIKLMSEKYPDMLIGAGTVLTIDQVDRAINAGAKFIVSTGFDPKIVDCCLQTLLFQRQLLRYLILNTYSEHLA